MPKKYYYKNINFSQEASFNLKRGFVKLRSLKFIIFFFAFIFLVLNLINFGVIVGKGLELKQLEEKIDFLKKNNQKLLIEISSNTNPQNLEEMASKLGMVRITATKYFNPLDKTLVVRQLTRP